MSLAILYVDESGVPESDPTQTTHYVVAGVAIAATTWASKYDAVEALKRAHGLAQAEIHVAWMVRPYPEQLRIRGFDALASQQRRRLVVQERLRLERALEARGDAKRLKELRSLHRRTDAYVHLTTDQRRAVVRDLAALITTWNDVTLFGEAIDKRAAQTRPFRTPPQEAAFEQVVTRFEAWLRRHEQVGVVAYDLNRGIAHRLTALTAKFQRVGGIWRVLHSLVGHPFFVDSQVSAMVQVADLASYALRRYCERGETDLFGAIFPRFDRLGGRLVGLRHYTGRRIVCRCLICREPR